MGLVCPVLTCLTILCIRLKSFLWAQNAFLKSLFSMGVQMSEPVKEYNQKGKTFLLVTPGLKYRPSSSIKPLRSTNCMPDPYHLHKTYTRWFHYYPQLTDVATEASVVCQEHVGAQDCQAPGLVCAQPLNPSPSPLLPGQEHHPLGWAGP